MWNEGQKTELSTQWSHGLLERPENQLTGVGFVWGGYHRSKISTFSAAVARAIDPSQCACC